MSESIDDVPLLVRREIEARIVAPFVEALSREFGREQVIAVLRQTIERVAREQGEQLASACGDNDLAALESVTQKWKQGGALDLNVLQRTDCAFDFNVTRCRYAEMYHRLGIPELGEVLSCGRDFTVSEGFNPQLKLTRTQTLMGGAAHCDFRFRLKRRAPGR